MNKMTSTSFKEFCASISVGYKEAFFLNNCQVVNCDSIDFLKKIPDNSISLILTDPPYHATKKKNIYGDTSFISDNEYLNWLYQYSLEWRRILKPNGSLYCFCDSSLASKIEILLEKNYNVLSHIVWTKPNTPGHDGWKGKMKKEALRQWYPLSERIIFAEPKFEGNLYTSYFANIIKEYRKKANLSQHKLTELIGAYGTVNHGGAVSNWEAGRNTPSKEQYEKIVNAITQTGKIDSMPAYEDVVRPFSVNKLKEFTDIWSFETVKQYKGKHPAEKPLDMLMHIIETSTYKGDIVLDCFAGSGNTGFAALSLSRKCILSEIDEHWYNSILQKLTAKPNQNLSLLTSVIPSYNGFHPIKSFENS